MKTIKLITYLAFTGLTAFMLATGCSTTSQIASQKSGAQLWGENCMRCHNTPSPETFGDKQWEVATTHMEMRALITDQEAQKILEFLQSAN